MLGTWFFCKDSRISTMDNSSQHKEGRFRSGLRKKLFATRVLKHQHRSPRELLAAPSLGTFEVSSDEALSNLIYLTTSLLLADHLVWVTLKGSFQPHPHPGFSFISL